MQVKDTYSVFEQLKGSIFSIAFGSIIGLILAAIFKTKTQEKRIVNLSIVIPLLNEQESLPELHTWIANVMTANNYSYEVIFIDDGSSDSSWQIIEKIATENPNIKGIRFQRNFGKSQAFMLVLQKHKAM